MKKQLFILLMATELMVQLIPTTALAANETSASTKVYYTYSKENNYELEIPAEINLNNSSVFYIRANSVTLEDGYSLQVSVNSISLHSDDRFTLSLTTNLAKQMPCQLFVCDEGAGTETALTSTNRTVVTFKDGDKYNSRYGALKIVPEYSGRSLPSGDYKGTLYFDIEVVPNQ